MSIPLPERSAELVVWSADPAGRLTVAGKPGTASIWAEHGHPVHTVYLELPLHLCSVQAGSGAPNRPHERFEMSKAV